MKAKEIVIPAIVTIISIVAIVGVVSYLKSRGDGIENVGGGGTPTSPATITLNPIADARVQSENADINYGRDPGLGVLYFNVSNIWEGRYNSYLMFDLSSIPTNSSIIDARLELYNYYIGEETTIVGAHYCPNVSWTELGITWNNAPSFSSTPTAETVLEGYKENMWYSWNITTDVQYALSVRKLSEVLKVEDIGPIFGAGFYSKDSGYYKPKLTITYS